MTKESHHQSSFAERLLELMPDALVIIDEQQRIVHVNPQAERLFQESAANILHQPLDVLLPQRACPRAPPLCAKLYTQP
ncbi:MAG: PAS domain-containing protein [Desulfovermiculus sp.]|nr:PAS domain-containing protein [Desulfovermiculus sp.]